MMSTDRVLISCEHGGNRVPAAYGSLFTGAAARAALASHRGHDAGALALARGLARHLGTPLHAATVTRLLVELNRSLGHPQLFSEFTAALPADTRQALLARYYHPYRERVAHTVRQSIRAHRRVLHLSVHSFTPVWHGQPRHADVGLLYDPRRAVEHRFSAAWKAEIERRAPDLRVRRNYPYRGTSDGLVTSLRQQFGTHAYTGIELEISQALIAAPGPTRRRLLKVTRESLVHILDAHL